MQTEIDQFLAEQNDLLVEQNALLAEQNSLLSQQVNSLKTILDTYKQVEQGLKDQIQTQQALIIELKKQISGLQQIEFSEALKTTFQTKLETQFQERLTAALTSLDLEVVVSSLVKAELKPLQTKLNSQQAEIKKSLLKIEQMPVQQDFYKDLEMQSKRIRMLGETVERLTLLLKNLTE